MKEWKGGGVMEDGGTVSGPVSARAVVSLWSARAYVLSDDFFGSHLAGKQA